MPQLSPMSWFLLYVVCLLFVFGVMSIFWWEGKPRSTAGVKLMLAKSAMWKW
uniref:ATPase synthase subunit 8 n=1 Tax=Terebratalia transversa TaxID=34513 RepID=Q953X7_TERTR|nr:ATP synthase F0 subunit 8 [Terebratalia transversa]AAK95499.1 ATPase synthase subunit 8 [Terebratalia transversa]